MNTHSGMVVAALLLVIVIMIVVLMLALNKDEFHQGDPVIFNGQTVILLGPAGNGDLYLVRLPDGTERHVLRKEIKPVKEKP